MADHNHVYLNKSSRSRHPRQRNIISTPRRTPRPIPLSLGLHYNSTQRRKNRTFKGLEGNCTSTVTDRTWTTCPENYPCYNGNCTRKEKANGAYKIKCSCHPGWVGFKCHICCDLPCVNGRCEIYEEGTRCVCVWGYDGPLCNQTLPYINASLSVRGKALSGGWARWQWSTVGVLSALMAVVVVLLLILPYWLWKKRIPVVMKLVQKWQKYKDDESRLFDAFISYRNTASDEEFVMRKLLPKMEKDWHLKLCLHQRDFMPGETIANNILWAVHNSRRTLLVLTPRFVKSEWTRFEYQIAQHEMLKLRHRIIPIMLEDITDLPDIDENLRSIIQSVTYIVWPDGSNKTKQAKFWDRLYVATVEDGEHSSSKSTVSMTPSSGCP